MKCPKCAYLGFETSERCRNCGYDFSLSVQVESSGELPLRNSEGAGAPLADFDLSPSDTSRGSDSVASLDLDRMIGGDGPPPVAPPAAQAPPRLAPALPLFARTAADGDDAPLIEVPRPAMPPLSVRRTTPEIPRGRARSSRVTPQIDEIPMGLDLEPILESEVLANPSANLDVPPRTLAAGAAARLVAALIDLMVLFAVDGGVLYLTLAIAGLPIDEAGRIPPIPLGAFFLMMNGGYIIVFTAASGQTIGKMVAGIRVVSDDGNRVDLPGAILRAAGCAVSLLTLGLGYLPAFFTAERRALQDRVAGTRVISVT